MATQVKFFELDAENKDLAVGQMYNHKVNSNWPNGAIWNSEEEVRDDLEQGFSADEYFSFYVNEFDEVTTKIG